MANVMDQPNLGSLPQSASAQSTDSATASEATSVLKPTLGRTLPSLLEEACRDYPNPKAFNERTSAGWVPMSNTLFKERTENMALGLLEMGLAHSDKVAFFTHSDMSFCTPDMACLTVGLVTVPIYLTHAPEAIKFILEQSEAKALIVSDDVLLAKIKPILQHTPNVKHIILRESKTELDFAGVEMKGQELRKANPNKLAEAKAAVKPHDLATLIYTSGTTGMPKGVMLTHENISSNAIGSMKAMLGFEHGKEQVLSFLPLTHIFARTLQYCMVWMSASVHYSHPDLVREHYREVRPTFFAAVPRVIEKAYERILATGASLTGTKRKLFDWALGLAQQYDINKEPTGLYKLQLSLASKLVFSKWREALGGNLKYAVLGGAATRPELVNIFAAAGIKLLQGYGLTETSPVVSFNRPHQNRPGSSGTALEGVEIKISEAGEIMTRGPHVMKGYYKNPEATKEVMTEDGWFRTGDLGEMDSDGFLKITGRIKNLFKLSTGKYVMPQPLEEKLESSPLIDVVQIVGDSEKYCGALLFINKVFLESMTPQKGIDALKSPEVKAHLDEVFSEANKGLSAWETLKKVALVLEELTIDNGMLTPKLSVKRHEVVKRYKAYIDELYRPSGKGLEQGVIVDVEGTAKES
ncbi:MAG: AMP-dependent synthetase/ligase [Trueperaceae bacterium]